MLEVGDTLWVQGDDGIFWFDGFYWNRISETEGLPSQRPTSLAASSTGALITVVGQRIYIGGSDGFVPLIQRGWDPERFHASRAFPTPWGIVVTAMDGVEESAGVYLLEEGGVRDITPSGALLFPAHLWPSRQGSVWLNDGVGLFHLEEGGWVPRIGPSASHLDITFLRESSGPRGVAFLRTPHSRLGLLSWEGEETPRRIVEEGENAVVSGVVTPDGLLFAVYETGDVRARGRDGWVSPEIPRSRAVGLHFVFQDSRGDLWFASERGLHLFRRTIRRWTSIRYPFPDARNRVNDILASPEGGDLWLATGGGLVHHQPTGSIEWIKEIDGEKLGSVTGLARDSLGGIWVTSGASFQGAYRWNGRRWERFGPDEGFDVGRVHRVHVGGDGAVWLLSLGPDEAVDSGGVYRYEGGRVERFRDDEGWLDTRTYAMAEGPDGSLWFGSGSGLSRLSEEGWAYWGPAEGVGGADNPRVFTLLPDSAGGVWFGYGPQGTLGLGHLASDGVVTHLTRSSGLPGDAVHAIALDSGGSIWISTDGGVARFDGEEWARFGGNAGLVPSQAWPLAFGQNLVYIGTTGGGLQVLNRAEEANPPPGVYLDGPVTVEGKTARVAWRALGYRGDVAPQLILVRHRVDDGPWSDWGTHRQLWISEDDDLSWGRHTVAVQAKGLYGHRSTPVVEAFAIPYPVHLRPIFYIPVGAVLASLVILLTGLSKRRKRTDRAIREREARLRTLVDTAPDGIAIYDAGADRFIDVNPNILTLTGYNREEFLATRLGETSPQVNEEGRESRTFLMERVQEALDGEPQTFEWKTLRKNGEELPVELRLVRFPAEGEELVRFSVLDIRDRKEYEARREELEAQLRQSQKLEAVGQLTGGVAHDFNNLLTVILGNMDLLRELREHDPEIMELTEGAIGAAERSALLTQRLLAFSRRQALDTRSIDIPKLVDGLLNLLQRSLGETIRIRSDFAPDLWPASADPGQLEHAIINLAVNARDAMSRGGDLFLEGKNVVLEPGVAEKWEAAPGEYVSLSVTDTGAGMDPEVRSRAFDPFFTTKEVGSGSGLGLSMVYGFVKQSGGFVKIYSEVGTGTAVQIFLPRADSDATAAAADPDEDVPRGRAEVILVVEDEPLLLALTKRLTERLGYRVVTAANGPAALEILRADTPVDLLFSDVVLPGGMDGVELAQAARRHRPGLRVLFTSGYAEQSVLSLAKELPDFDLLSKPFDTRTLATKLRKALGI